MASHLRDCAIEDVNNVDANKQRIAICALSGRPTIEVGGMNRVHLGPRVSFMNRTESNASVHVQWSKDMAESDEGTGWRWQWVGSAPTGYNDFDWKISIENAVANDLFDMGYISEHHNW